MEQSNHSVSFRPALSLSLLACRQSCVTEVATRPGRISAQEDFLPSQLEHLHIAQFKGQGSEVKLITIQSIFNVMCIFQFTPKSKLYINFLLHIFFLACICFYPFRLFWREFWNLRAYEFTMSTFIAS